MQQLGRLFLFYTGAGAIATMVHYFVLVVAVEGFRSLAWQGALIGGLAGALVAYGAHHQISFCSIRAHSSAVPRFAVIALAGARLQAAIVALATLILHLHYLLAQVAATGVALLAPFFANRRWTY